MTLALETPGLLSLAAGFTDTRTLPSDLIASAARELADQAEAPEYLQYGMNQGRPGLRRVLAQRLQTTEPAYSVEALTRSMMISNGSQQALYLAVQVLCDPGDIVYVDRPSYFVFLEMLTGLGVEARSIPTTESGQLDPAAFAQSIQTLKREGEVDRLRAIYFVSYFSNPSARSMAASEKTTLAEILAANGLLIPVIEDAAYRELYFRSAFPASSVLSLPAWSAFPRMYTSTLTKPFSTGMKVGYTVCTDEEWLKKMLHVKGHQDFGTANFNQAVFERVLQTGKFDQHLQQVRKVYETKMQSLHDGLVAAGLPQLGWIWEKPTGGLYLWLQAPAKLDTGLEGEFCRACLANGVVYVPGDLCFGDHAPQGFVRLSFGVLSPTELAEAARRFVATAKQFEPCGG